MHSVKIIIMITLLFLGRWDKDQKVKERCGETKMLN